MPSTIAVLAANLGAQHGYLIEGDTVHLHAEIIVYDHAIASTQSWSLQLWACDDTYKGGPLLGHKTAEVALGSLSEITNSGQLIQASSPFHAPAGGGEFAMVLILAAEQLDQPTAIHGYANYLLNEQILVPRLRGKSEYSINGSSITLVLPPIENPRAANNLSGTLAVELWALPAAYQGGNFSGAPIAGAVLGTLSGQCEWNPPPIELAFKTPPDGLWYFVLMLREWTGTGYTTRDFYNFPKAEAPVITAPKTENPSPADVPVTTETVAVATIAPAIAPAKASAAAPEKIVKAKKAPAAAGKTSINSATATELAALDGVSPALAKAIIATRPYEKIDDVLRAKGMGPKTLAKLKSKLVL